jgi:hypothetical protein
MPARDAILLSRRTRVVIAGRELRFNPCNPLMRFPAKLNDRRVYNDDRTAGISMKRFPDRSRDTRFGASDVQAGAVKPVNPHSDMHRYLRHCHFSSGRVFALEVFEDTDEFETTLLERYSTRPREEELLRELEGRGDVARWPW